MNTEQVQGTNDSSIVSKLSMVERGYFEDPFIKHFVEKPSRRSPLINRCYFARSAAVSHAVERFLGDVSGSKQIISLGAGFDTTYFRMKAKCLDDDLRFIEVDFPEVMRRKVSLAKNAKLVSEASDNSCQFKTEKELDMLIYNSTDYSCLGFDLQNVGKKFHALLETIGVDFHIPTLFLSEVVLTYIPSKSSSGVLQWIGENFSNAVFVVFEQVTPLDGFGKVMCKHFKQIGSPLLTINEYPTISSHIDRHKSYGFVHCGATSLDRFYHECLSKEKRQIVESMEVFDEYEAWHKACQHYFILCSTNSEKEMLQNYSQFLFEEHQFLYNKMDFPPPVLKKIELKTATSTLQRFGHTMSLIQAKNGEQYAVIIGGFGLSEKGRAHQRLSNNVVIQDLETMEIYQCNLNNRTLTKSLQYPMFATSVSSGTNVYYFGGRASPIKCSNSLMKMTFSCDEHPDIWTYKFTEIQTQGDQIWPEPRWRHSAVLLETGHGGKFMIVFGGRNIDTILEDFWLFDIVCNKWRRISVSGDTILPRHSHSMCVFGEKSLLLSGGLGDFEVIFNDVYEVNILDEECTAAIVQRLIFPISLSSFYAHTSHYYCGHLFLIGGVKFNHNSVYGDTSSQQKDTIDVLDMGSRTSYKSISVASSNGSPLLLHNHSSEILSKSHELLIVGGGDNCFSFGTWFNEAPFPVDLSLILNKK